MLIKNLLSKIRVCMEINIFGMSQWTYYHKTRNNSQANPLRIWIKHYTHVWRKLVHILKIPYNLLQNNELAISCTIRMALLLQQGTYYLFKANILAQLIIYIGPNAILL